MTTTELLALVGELNDAERWLPEKVDGVEVVMPGQRNLFWFSTFGIRGCEAELGLAQMSFDHEHCDPGDSTTRDEILDAMDQEIECEILALQYALLTAREARRR